MGRNALITAIVLLLGIGTAAAVARSDDNERAGNGVAQSGPDTTTAPPTPTTSTPTTAGPPASDTAEPADPTGGSGLASDDAGQVAMGPTMPNTGVDSAIGVSTVLVGAGVGLRALVGRRRAP